MERLNLVLENCYGIKNLRKQIDFSQHKACTIYAPNGSMKTSLANTFKDIADGISSQDRVFPNRKCIRTITDENGVDLPTECVLVIRPYDEELGHSEKTSTLLVNSELRKEYEELHKEIDNSKDLFLRAIKEQSKSKKDIEKEISSTFTKSEDEFYTALIRVENEIIDQKDAPFADIVYDKIFDDKVLALLNGKDVKAALEEYIKKYNELISKSTYFKKGIFSYYNAATIAKNLADNGFFNAKHSVNLNADEKIEITNEKQLEELIAKEKEQISNDKELRKKFEHLEKALYKNVTVRDFKDYIDSREDLLPSLSNIEKFKEDIWKSYFKAKFEPYSDLIEKYRAAEKRKKEIEEKAREQRTQWEQVIEIFNSRFFVPFVLTAKNRVSVILGQEPILSLGFTFQDGQEEAPVEKAALMKVLSNGEKKALYVLNIIFEVEARKKLKQETVFVIDDIADSFDYKNKYAIIQYLKDIADEPCFKQIILTHNFDFFRTIQSRFIPYSHCLMAIKRSDGISLEAAVGIRNIFVNDWKKNFFTDVKKRIASIPFIRNIIEYTRGATDPGYVKLTSLLHWKNDSEDITQDDLDRIYNEVFNDNGSLNDGKRSMIDIIRDEAQGCLDDADGINFENKIVLSIAIRLFAEKYMVEKINDPVFINSIDINQTQKLLDKFKDLFSGDTDHIDTIQRVILMTPENIHLNSFMYEPILDMSDEHLRKLYKDVSNLK